MNTKNHSTKNQRCQRFFFHPKSALISAMLTGGLLLMGTEAAWATQDPPSCSGTGGEITLDFYYNDGVTPIPLGTEIAECGSFKVRSTVGEPSGQQCAFEGVDNDGVLEEPGEVGPEYGWDITTCRFGDNPTRHNVVPVGGVPQIGGDNGIDGINSQFVDFAVSEGCIVNGQVWFSTKYTANFSHSNPNDANHLQDTPRLGTDGSLPVVTCDDGLFCTGEETCDPQARLETGQCVPGTRDCGDGDVCTTDTCNEDLNQCEHTPGALNCDDNNVCTTDACDSIEGCVNTPGALNCNDNNVCTTDSCDPLEGCVNTPGALNCNDNNVCTTDSCDPLEGCVNAPGALDCDDHDACTDDSCDPIKGCQHVDNGTCQAEVCRTPGFWATHAGNEKSNSEDITDQVIAAGGGEIEICGEKIKDTRNGTGKAALNDAASAAEAMCVSIKGNKQYQVARQLTAMALNCITTNGNADCSGVSISDLFADCNAACDAESAGTTSTRSISECISAVDCFNNGGTYNGGACTISEDNCHKRALDSNGIVGPFKPAAGSSNLCNSATGNTCNVVQPGENNCAKDSDLTDPAGAP